MAVWSCPVSRVLGVEAGIKTSKGAAEGFAGAEAGGALSGAVEWLPPADFARARATPAHSPAAAPTGTRWRRSRRKGTLRSALAPKRTLESAWPWPVLPSLQSQPGLRSSVLGAGGGFGTVVDLEKVWDLIVLVCETLHDVEYRPILGIEEQAFGAI